MSPTKAKSATKRAPKATKKAPELVFTDAVTGAPDVGPLRVGKLPKVEERTLASGLRVLAIRRPTVPLVEVRLLIPTARGAKIGDGAVERVVGEAMLAGTGNRSAVDIASEIQQLGASLGVSAGLEQMMIYGSALSANLAPFFELFADVVVNASYPKSEVEVHRGRVAQELAIARSQPGTVASEAILGALYGDHAYGRRLPPPEAATALTQADVRRFHRDRVSPADAVLVVVGDVRPAKLFALVDKTLAGWAPSRSAPKPVPVPSFAEPGPIRIVHRPGAVQTSIRLAGPSTTRLDELHPALLVAHTAFGGGFSSRLNHNLREDKGYTYGAGCGIDHRLRSSYLLVQADVATAVTAPALAEIQYELARMVTNPLTADEITSAKRFRNGQMALALQSQLGFVGFLSSLLPHGLGIDYLKRLPAEVDAVDADQALEAAKRYLAPSRMLTVLVGDADAIASGIEPLGAVEVVGG